VKVREYYSFFIILVEGKPEINKVNAFKNRSKNRKVIIIFLMFIWCFLISLAFISAADPPWLRELSQIGRQGGSRAMLGYGDDYLHQGDYNMAIAQYQKALKIKPDYVGAAVNMAICYNKQGNTNQAIWLLEDALKRATAYRGIIYYNIAEIFEEQGKIDDAIANYEKAIGTELDQSLVYRKLGPIFLDMKDYPKALDAFNKLLAIQTDVTMPYQLMLKNSLPGYETDSLNQVKIKSLIETGVTVEKLSAYDLTTIKNNMADDKEIAKTHNHLAFIYAMQNNIDAAIDHFEQSLKIWPGNQDATKNLPLLRQMKQKQLAANAN